MRSSGPDLQNNLNNIIADAGEGWAVGTQSWDIDVEKEC